MTTGLTEDVVPVLPQSRDSRGALIQSCLSAPASNDWFTPCEYYLIIRTPRIDVRRCLAKPKAGFCKALPCLRPASVDKPRETTFLDVGMPSRQHLAVGQQELPVANTAQ